MASLFRPEAIEGQQQAWLGSIQLVRPVSFGVLTALALFVALAAGALLLEGRYTRKAHISGYLVPDRGVMRLEPPQPGIVAESHAVEGRSVRRGDVLFVLAVDRASVSGDTQAAVQASLGARRSSLEDASRQAQRLQREQIAGIDRQIADTQRELAQLDAEERLVREQLVLKQQDLDQYTALMANDNFVSPAHLRSKKAEVLDVQARLQAVAAKRAAQSRALGVLESNRREVPLRSMAALGEIDRDLAALAGASAESAAKQTIVVRAPQDGVVSAVLAAPGQSVAPGAALASLVPAGARLQAHLFAPSSAVGFVQSEQQVQLRYQAFPYQKFGHHAGQVLQVSRTPLQASELAGLPLPESLKAAPTAEPLYRITVALDEQAVRAYGKAQPLVAGMQLDADVLLDRRRLIEWIFEPLLSVTGRV